MKSELAVTVFLVSLPMGASEMAGFVFIFFVDVSPTRSVRRGGPFCHKDVSRMPALRGDLEETREVR